VRDTVRAAVRGLGLTAGRTGREGSLFGPTFLAGWASAAAAPGCRRGFRLGRLGERAGSGGSASIPRFDPSPSTEPGR